jgi:hypothetical protein
MAGSARTPTTTAAAARIAGYCALSALGDKNRELPHRVLTIAIQADGRSIDFLHGLQGIKMRSAVLTDILVNRHPTPSLWLIGLILYPLGAFDKSQVALCKK